MAAMDANTTDRIASKVANFRNAVQTKKNLAEHEHLSRMKRYQEVDKTLATTEQGERRDLMVQAFAAREREAVLAKVKCLSTKDFESVKTLGQGSFGTVHLVRKKGSDEYYALKQMKKASYQRKNYLERAFAERNILAEASSRWFVDLYATFQDADNIFMLMEFLQGGDLIYHLIEKHRFSLRETRFYMAELLEALNCVHCCGFVHRDVKPDNIVLTKGGHLKLLDFGLCKHGGGREEKASVAACMPGADVTVRVVNKCGQTVAEFQANPDTETVWNTKNRIAASCGIPAAQQRLRKGDEFLEHDVCKLVDCGVGIDCPMLLTVFEEKKSAAALKRQYMKSNVGTPQYMAPEVWESSLSGYGPEADIWSVGIIAFECLVGHCPFHAGNVEGPLMMDILLQKISRFEQYLPRQLEKGREKNYLNPSSQSFLSTVLVRKEERATVPQCRDHPFFFGIDWRNLHLTQPPIIPQVSGPADTSYFDDFPTAALPTVACDVKKDANMDFAHYEFDKRVKDLHKPVINMTELVR